MAWVAERPFDCAPTQQLERGGMFRIELGKKCRNSVLTKGSEGELATRERAGGPCQFEELREVRRSRSELAFDERQDAQLNSTNAKGVGGDQPVEQHSKCAPVSLAKHLRHCEIVRPRRLVYDRGVVNA